MWINSVISASLRWEGRMSQSATEYEAVEWEMGFVVAEEGLTSARMDIGDIELSMFAELC